MLTTALRTNKNAKRNNTIASGNIFSAAHIRYRYGPLFSHCGEKFCKNATVDGSGYVMMFECKCIGVGFRFVEDERSNHAAGSNLREIVQHIIQIRNIGAVCSSVIHLAAFFFRNDDSGFAVFLELFANSGFVEHHGRFKSRQIFLVDLLEQLGNGFLHGRIVENVK